MCKKNGRFLVVDDDRDMRFLLETFLKARSYDVLCVESGEAALEVLNQNSDTEFDAIFMDIVMPGLSGLQLSQRLIEDSRVNKITRVMVTSLDTYDDLLKGYSSGGDYYLTKPIDSRQLDYALDLMFSPISEKPNDKSYELIEEESTVGE